MAGNRIMQGGAAHRAVLAVAAILALAVALAGCGASGEPTTAAADRQADADALNRVLSRQMAVVGAYDEAIEVLRGRRRAMARRFRAQEQEHIDAVTRALQGLEAEAEPEAEEAAPPTLPGEAERLAYLAELEGRTIEIELGAIAALTDSHSRAVLGSIVANQAQHLVLLRRALGARPLQTVPSAFETGAEPLPQG
jgi:rubrerythrin